jgi:threonine dehydratase
MDLADIGVHSALVLTDPVVNRLLPVKTVLESLDTHGIEYRLYDRVRIEPTDESFLDAIAFAERSQFQAIVAVGGGGLFAGVSRAIKLINPSCRTYGVEPEGADNLRRALEAGQPVRMPKIATIADSLAPPGCAEYSFGLCKENLDELVVITDDEMRRAMAMLVEEIKIAVEPAGAAAAAALWHVREQIRGQRVGVLVCGSNIDAASFAKLISQ